jgi:hypothetical protein
VKQHWWRNSAAQFVNGETVPYLKPLLEAFGDTNVWEQLMLLTTPVEGFGPDQETLFQLLGRKPDKETVRQLIAPVTSWAA